jgi:hypothetical protein
MFVLQCDPLLEPAEIRFNNAPWSSITRRNIEEWLAWSCFGLKLEDVQNDTVLAESLENNCRYLEARTGMSIPDGHNPKVKVLRLNLDPVHVSLAACYACVELIDSARARPLLLYAWSELTNLWLRKVEYPFYGLSLVSGIKIRNPLNDS